MSLPRSLTYLTAALLALAAAPLYASQNEFCKGFNKGYLEGYEWASGSIFEPSVPLCPLMPRKTARDPSDDFEHGYEMGYDQGRDAGRKRFR